MSESAKKLKYQCDILEAGLIDIPVSTMFMGSNSGNNSAVTSVELAGFWFLLQGNKRDGWSFVICFQFSFFSCLSWATCNSSPVTFMLIEVSDREESVIQVRVIGLYLTDGLCIWMPLLM